MSGILAGRSPLEHCGSADESHQDPTSRTKPHEATEETKMARMPLLPFLITSGKSHPELHVDAAVAFVGDMKPGGPACLWRLLPPWMSMTFSRHRSCAGKCKYRMWPRRSIQCCSLRPRELPKELPGEYGRTAWSHILKPHWKPNIDQHIPRSANRASSLSLVSQAYPLDSLLVRLSIYCH